MEQLEFIPFTGTVEELPNEYKHFIGKFIASDGYIEYHVITRIQEDLYQIGAVFHFDFWGTFVGYRGLE